MWKNGRIVNPFCPSQLTQCQPLTGMVTLDVKRPWTIASRNVMFLVYDRFFVMRLKRQNFIRNTDLMMTGLESKPGLRQWKPWTVSIVINICSIWTVLAKTVTVIYIVDLKISLIFLHFSVRWYVAHIRVHELISLQRLMKIENINVNWWPT